MRDTTEYGGAVMTAPPAPFRIEVPDDVLDDLRARLDRARRPAGLLVAGGEDRARLAHVERLLQRWRTGYDWRAHERALNALPQFRVVVDGVALHLVHARAGSARPRPLLLVHGWPSTFAEYAQAVPLLTGAGFDVVVPSRPGYGFSDPGLDRDGSDAATADLFARLMSDVLGYDRFLAHGDDFGGSIVSLLAHRHPDAVAAIHVSEWLEPADPVPHDAAERLYLDDLRAWRESEYGYGHVAATRPQTLGLALDDSPVGLLGWIADKFLSWTDPRADDGLPFDPDFLLTTVTLYWVTRSITTSMRPYALPRATLTPADRIPVPASVVAPREDHPAPPRSWLERVHADLRSYRIRTLGGHFLAAEDPRAFVDELLAAFPTADQVSGATDV